MKKERNAHRGRMEGRKRLLWAAAAFCPCFLLLFPGKADDGTEPLTVVFEREPETVQGTTSYFAKPCGIQVRFSQEAFNRYGADIRWETNSLEDNSIERGKANGWQRRKWDYDREEGDYIKNYTADQDGMYCLSVSYTDGEGQVFHYEGAPFVVDQTEPKISIQCRERVSSQDGEMAWNEKVFLVEIGDLSFCEEKTSVYLRRNEGQWEPQPSVWVQAGDGAFTEAVCTGEESWEILVEAEDFAGNTASAGAVWDRSCQTQQTQATAL